MNQTPMLVLVLGGIVLLVFLIVRAKRAYLEHREASPKRLFEELCRAHQLSRHHRQLLLRVAAQYELGDPARLFLEPERFDQVAPALASPKQLEGLKRQLFC